MSFDRNLIVIGAGSAGLVAAYLAAILQARVTLVERDRMGGECLNTGCIPSKALIHAARQAAQIRRAGELGLRAQVEVDFARVMEHVAEVVRAIAPHDSVERFARLGVECLRGTARLISPHSVEVQTDATVQTITARAIVLATGSRPAVPSIPGIERTGYLTSDTVWALRELPRRLLVLGGGPVACELAQCFARFGSHVEMVEKLPRLLPREDEDVSRLLGERFAAEGIVVHAGCEAARFIVNDNTKALVVAAAERETTLAFDALLCATGRVPNATGYGLEELGLRINASGAIETDAFMRTTCDSVYACGDIAGPYQLTHAASHQATQATLNALFGRFRRWRADRAVLPQVTFTEPEVARVGLNESEARVQNIAFDVTRHGFDELDRAITDHAGGGFIKVLTEPGKDRMVGATIVGQHAGEIIAELTLAMQHGLGLGKILDTIHAYPTYAEAVRLVAAQWKQAHLSDRTQRWLHRYHGWQR